MVPLNIVGSTKHRGVLVDWDGMGISWWGGVKYRAQREAEASDFYEIYALIKSGKTL